LHASIVITLLVRKEALLLLLLLFWDFLKACVDLVVG